MRRLSEVGARLYRLYASIEESLGFKAGREAVAAWNLAWAVSPSRACDAARAVEESLEGRAACIVGPMAPGLDGGCEVVVAAGESGLARAAGLGARPAAVATDLDGSAPVAARGSWTVFAHIHSDNLHLAAQAAGSGLVDVLTAQAPVPGWVLSPFGFADGDRAVLIAVGLGAGEIRVIGIDLAPEEPKFKASIAYIEAALAEACFKSRMAGRFRLEARPA